MIFNELRDRVKDIRYVRMNGGAWDLDYIITDEGRVRRSGTVYTYEYDIKDHLGNTRVTVVDSAGTGLPRVAQLNSYYGFGMDMPGSGVSYASSPKNNYLYNGKELVDDLGWYDYGARMYDPAIARWNAVDPLAEFAREFSPYTYTENNPVSNIDPDGMWKQTIHGWTSESAQEAQDFLTALKRSQENGGTTEYSDGDGKSNEAFRMITSGENGTLAQIFYNNSGAVAKDRGTESAKNSLAVGLAFTKKKPELSEAVLLTAAVFATGAFINYLSDYPLRPEAIQIRQIDNVINKEQIIRSEEERTADELLPGSLKRSPSYNPKYGNKTRSELQKLAKKGDQIAKKMKKLVDDAPRLLDKNRNK